MASIFKRGGRKGKGGYFVEYSERPGLRRTVYAGRDLAAAQALARKLEADAMLRRKGVMDDRAERWAAADARPLAEHVSDFLAALRAARRTEKHVRLAAARIRRVIEAVGAGRLSDLAPSAVQGAIGLMIEGENMAMKTANGHVQVVKQLSRWAWLDGRARDYALAPVRGYNAATDRRLVRRALTDTELSALLHAAHEGGPVLGMAGPDRAMLYALAVGSGFRAGELASLTPESFNLAACPPTATVDAGYSKRRRRDVQPLPRGLAEALGPWLESKAAGAPVFGRLARTADMLRADLEAAGVPDKTAEGVADFHSLRHTYVSRLVRSGVNVKLCQELARHSDPKLTLGIYAHVDMQDKALALATVPALEAPRDVVAEAAAGITARGAAHATQGVPCHGLPQGHDGAETEVDESESETPGRARIANPGVSYDGSGEGIRTLDLRVMNPLL